MVGPLAPILVVILACSGGQDVVVTDTDVFRPDSPKERVRTVNIPSDLNGVWEVRVPQVLGRKVEVIEAGIQGRPENAFDPPLSNAEKIWFTQAGNPEHPYVAWYRCAQRCRFEISDSSIWNYGYNPFSEVGSGLMETPEIVGREVDIALADHDPNGHAGRIKLRMNRQWTAFRVIEFDLDGFRDPHLGQKLELYYERASD